MRSGEFKEKLSGFMQDFTWIRGHVLEIVHIQSAISIDSMNINIQRIIETLGRDGAREAGLPVWLRAEVARKLFLR